MAEKRGGLPVGLLVATPPMLAGIYLGAVLLMDSVLPIALPDVLEAPLRWFELAVYDPLLDVVGLPDLSGVTLWKRMLVDVTIYFGFFLLVGLVLGGIAALVNLLVFRGGTGGEKG